MPLDGENEDSGKKYTALPVLVTIEANDASQLVDVTFDINIEPPSWGCLALGGLDDPSTKEEISKMWRHVKKDITGPLFVPLYPMVDSVNTVLNDLLQGEMPENDSIVKAMLAFNDALRYMMGDICDFTVADCREEEEEPNTD